MEEKILIKSNMGNTKIILLILVWIGIIVGFICGFGVDFDECIPILIASLAITTIIIELYSHCSLTVSEKRVYGKAVFGKRVDLPIDSISAVGTSWLGGIDIATSSGRIHFKFIKNRNEIHKIIGDLLVQRQTKNSETIIKQEIPQSNADELKKYKDLLDSGVITQEEFDQKKKQLLGL